jgi:hypothetical protein
MYERYCYENGWLAKYDNKGRYQPLAEYEKRKVGDILWEANVATTEVVTSWTFQEFGRSISQRFEFESPAMKLVVNVQFSEMPSSIDSHI